MVGNKTRASITCLSNHKDSPRSNRIGKIWYIRLLDDAKPWRTEYLCKDFSKGPGDLSWYKTRQEARDTLREYKKKHPEVVGGLH